MIYGQYVAGVPMPSNKFDTSFNIVGEEEKILTGVFGNKNFGTYYCVLRFILSKRYVIGLRVPTL